jgi:hypothetical protein
MDPTQNPAPRPPRLAEQFGIGGVDVTPADYLRAAALYLRRHGWTRGGYYQRDAGPFPPACALGAIGMAVHGRTCDTPFFTGTVRARQRFERAYEVLDAYLADTVTEQPGYGDVGTWNDAPGRTHDDVVMALQAAADAWEHQHSGGGR